LRLTEAERKVMEVLWANAPITATEMVKELEKTVQWRKTTTYTMITRCIEKGYIRREDPGFRCYPLISKEDVTKFETDRLIRQGYDGSADLLVAALVGEKKLSLEKLQALYETLKDMEQD